MTPVFLLDTDVISLAGLKRPPPGLHSWLKAMGASSLALSFPVIAELMRGAHLARHRDPQKAERLLRWIDAVTQVNFRYLQLNPLAAEVYADLTTINALKHLRAVSTQQKSDKMGHDLLIAALAISHCTPIASCNVKDYLTIHRSRPIPGLYHPLERKWHVLPTVPTSLPLIPADQGGLDIVPRI